MRPETGSMEFEGDQPGVFIRGNDALRYEAMIRKACDTDINALGEYQLRELASLLVSCHQNVCVFNPPQRMKEFSACARGPCFACQWYKREHFSPKILDYVTACDCRESPRYRQQVRSDDGCGEWDNGR